MDVQFLHTGEPVLVIEEGEGEPGGYVIGPNRTQVWTENADYRPAKVVVLGAVTEVEPGQIAGSDYADTATAQREAAIADGSHPATLDAQYVHQPEAAGVGAGSPVVGADNAGAGRTPLGSNPTGANQQQLSDTERDELNRLRAASAEQGDQAGRDNADVQGRDTSAAAGAGNATT